MPRRFFLTDVKVTQSGIFTTREPSLPNLSQATRTRNAIPDSGAWALVEVDQPGQNWQPFINFAGIDPFPDAPLTTPVAALDVATLAAALTRRGIATTLLTGAATLGDAITAIGRLADPQYVALRG